MMSLALEVYKIRQRQIKLPGQPQHVVIEAWDGSKWIDLDKVSTKGTNERRL
jgi:hypothetical protein